jgi:hypothetical protein
MFWGAPFNTYIIAKIYKRALAYKFLIIDNIQVDEYSGFVHFQVFLHIEPLLGVDVRFQNYSLMENDTGSRQIMQLLHVDGARHSKSSTSPDVLQLWQFGICLFRGWKWTLTKPLKLFGSEEIPPYVHPELHACKMLISSLILENSNSKWSWFRTGSYFHHHKVEHEIDEIFYQSKPHDMGTHWKALRYRFNDIIILFTGRSF